MKKIAVCMLVALILVLGGCSALKPEAVASYPKGSAPSQVIKTEDQWVMLMNDYGKNEYSISVSETVDAIDSVYSVDDVSIWHIEANESGVVWCELSDESYTYKVYDINSQSVNEIFTVSATEYQPQNVGIFENSVYLCEIDYSGAVVRVREYDFSSGEISVIIVKPFVEENQPYSINVEGNHLSFVCAEYVEVINLQSGEIAFDAILPESVRCVFSVSYDSVNDNCALYYADGDSEDIGFIAEGEDEISSVFTFSRNHYAYMDKIECYDGHIYWITQANVSGNVTDHYRFIDYNYLDHKPTETNRTLSFCRNQGELYLLRFNISGEYTHMDLCLH